MKRTRLGVTDIEITPIGLGTFALGGGDWAYGWGDQDDEDSFRAIHAAADAGINWIETAAVYGLGRAEEIIGQALQQMPSEARPFVFTKCGMRWDPNDRFARPTRVGAQDSLRAELEASLRRLNTDSVDLYQIHWPADDGTEIEDYWATLVQMRSEGKVRAAGLCNHNLELVERAEAIGHVDSLQLPLSAIARDATEIAEWCAVNEVAFLAWAPMQAGLLTGAFDQNRVDRLDRHDWRRASPYFTTGLGPNLEVAQTIAAVAARHQVSPAAVAVAWVLHCDGVTGAIVGARRPTQLAGWLPAADLELSAADLDLIAATITATGAGSGPARPPSPRAGTPN
jgi:aryl-alcohol dehydrogenase-like predicted oxidoreductase